MWLKRDSMNEKSSIPICSQHNLGNWEIKNKQTQTQNRVKNFGVNETAALKRMVIDSSE